jgi:MFS superfamily sulfate permease-like transporter
MGVIWLILAFTGIMEWLAKVTPTSVVRGIQSALGVILAVQAFEMLSTWWLLGIVSIIIVLALRQNRYAPAAIILMVLGVVIMFFRGQLAQIGHPNPALPSLTGFHIEDIWQSLMRAGFAQVPLTATNAVIATAALIKGYWPDRPVGVRALSLNMGLMNLVVPFFGGMPLCHGAGGLAGQYYFGARTGGANILEGLIEISLGALLATSIAGLFGLFPTAIIGAMLLLVGIELTKFARDMRLNRELIPMAVTLVVSVGSNMAFGFLAGLIVFHLGRFLIRGHDDPRNHANARGRKGARTRP